MGRAPLGLGVIGACGHHASSVLQPAAPLEIAYLQQQAQHVRLPMANVARRSAARSILGRGKEEIQHGDIWEFDKDVLCVPIQLAHVVVG